MENNDSNPKPQQTGGLKLMTVFIAVLALHVIVIGGFTIIHLMSGGGTDADLATDKTHKEVKVTPDSATVSDGQLPDGVSGDKSATASADTSGTPMTIPAPPTTPTPADSTTPPASDATAAPAPAPPDASATASATEPTSSAPSGPIQSGPVITPPASAAPSPEVASEPAATPATESETTGGTPYVVKSHDSLARIAHQHHVKVAALRSANGLKSDMLRIGQKLVIPGRTTQEASSGLSALREPNTTLLGDSPDLAPATEVASTSHDKAELSSTTGSRHIYLVAKGDTLNRIAHKFHTSPSAIMSLNNISDARKLRLGQKLKIPSQESRSATSTPAARAQPDRIEPRATPSAQLANFIN
jgi:LysM repeat protein